MVVTTSGDALHLLRLIPDIPLHEGDEMPISTIRSDQTCAEGLVFVSGIATSKAANIAITTSAPMINAT